ncbi:hypothetical protein [Halobacteriaceae bacterium SHR40]|uniref:hypothetical protein n=1 Tax=Halovenus amylolytica TaxID=2500550 RepID=UPI000FE31FD6
MTTARRQALYVDFSLAVTALLFATLAGGTPLSGEGVLIAGVGLGVFVGTLFVAERSDVLALINRTRPMSLVVATAAFLGVGVALIAGQGIVAAPAANLLWGMGVGLGGYRIQYGVRTPLPKKRRKQAEMWGEPPDPEELDGNS